MPQYTSMLSKTCPIKSMHFSYPFRLIPNPHILQEHALPSFKAHPFNSTNLCTLDAMPVGGACMQFSVTWLPSESMFAFRAEHFRG